MRTLKGSYTPRLLLGLASFVFTRTSLGQAPATAADRAPSIVTYRTGKCIYAKTHAESRNLLDTPSLHRVGPFP